MAQAPPRSLYDRDFLAWCEDTAARLRDRDISHLDWDNLIEEIESLGRSSKREVRHRLTVLLGHLLKRCYVRSPYDYRGWESTIFEQASALLWLLEDSPSLKPHFDESFPRAWELALLDARKNYPAIAFPHKCPFPADPEALLARRFWEPQD